MLVIIVQFSRPGNVKKTIDAINVQAIKILRRLDMNSAVDGGNQDFVADASAVKILWKRVSARFKIYVTLYQIVSILPFTLELRFPSAYRVIASALSVFNLSFSRSGVVHAPRILNMML